MKDTPTHLKVLEEIEREGIPREQRAEEVMDTFSEGPGRFYG